MDKEQQKTQALLKIEELKRYISNDEIKKEVKLEIKFCDGEICFSSTKTTIKEAVIEAIEKGVNLYNTNLSNADLYGVNLSNANLSGVNLSNANLRYTNLSNANLYNTNLSNANLRDANLCGTNLCGTNLYNTNLSNAEMENAKFYGKGGNNVLKKSQITDFLKALGFIIE